MKINEILDTLEIMFPDARCELLHENPFQLAVAVALSAQTTDVSVNKVTPNLFLKFPDAISMSNADLKEIEQCIKSIGLYKTKSRNIKGLAETLIDLYDGNMPKTLNELIQLPGIGRKSANVIMSVSFDIPAIAVDTHVERVAKRLKLAKESDSVLEVEKKLMKKIDKNRWNKAHHLFIFFGRYKCQSRNPKCSDCPFIQICRYAKANNIINY